MAKNERICIIGAGPAGLAAAMYLEKKGYTNYTIFEKANRVGGKCFSPKMKVTHNGVTEEKSFETGAIMGAITYHAIHEMEEFGGYHHAGPDWKENEPNMRREFRTLDGKVYEPFNPKSNFTFKKLFGLLKLKKQMKQLNEIMQTKYFGYDCYGHLGVAKGEYYGLSKGVEGYCGATKENSFPNYIKGSNPNLKDLALPYNEFCKLNGVERVQDIWLAPFTSFGYGYFDEIPAALVMKYLDVTTALQFVNMKLWTWEDGTEQIFVHVNDKLKNPAILNTEVIKVERPEGKVLVTVKYKDEVRTEEFDKLIVTTPLDLFKDIADATKEEKELFSKIVHERYCDFIATFEEGKSPNISGYMLDNMVPDRLGHAMVYYNRWQYLDRDCPATVYALRNHNGDKETVSFDYTIKTMTEDMEKVGFPIKEKFYVQEVYYCPHVSCEEYADGWYDKVEAIQGAKNTYYAGEILSFGDMEDTCAISKDIVERFF